MIRLPAGRRGPHRTRQLLFTLSRLLGSAAAILSPAVGSAWAEDLAVVATIKPVHALVAQVMGDTGKPKLLVGGTASPHTYSLKPSDAKALNNARLIFRVSEDIEPFTRKIVAALPKTVSVITLAGAPGLTLLNKRSGNTFEAHEHGDAHAHDHDHDHGHGDHNEAEAKGPVRDGHIWLDPRNGVAMVKEITRALSEVAPDKTTTFEANAAAAIAGIEAAATEIDAELASVKGKPFVVFHDAYQYFEERFKVPAAGAITISPEVQPSAKRLGEIRRKIKDLDVACVFAEPQFKSKLVATVVEGTGAKAGTLDPEGASIEAGPDAYVALLKNLAQGLKGCLTS
jgi:zinc transport system substrate-binding protein